jgi:hypothetical protein
MINTGKLGNSKVNKTIHVTDDTNSLTQNNKLYIQKEASKHNILHTITSLPDYTIKYRTKTHVIVKGNTSRKKITAGSFKDVTDKVIQYIA